MTLESMPGKHLRMLTSNLVREFKANKKVCLKLKFLLDI